ncbi:MAG: isocitrate lyase/PEP mutase family protein, partial [Acidobacteria bacterium]|nr:isocitrate lyase/PEP mutase family protein [Acidobacteriota bacterium]
MRSQTPNAPTRTPSRRRFIQSAGVATGAAFAGSVVPAGTAAAQSSGSDSPGARFRGLLGGENPPYCVNCGDVGTARLAEMHGFQIVMTGGSALSFSKYGIGDFGMITMDDLVEFCSRTADRIDTPIIADADDGGGNPLNVYRTVQRMEKAGAACVMIEDLYGAKHLAGYDEGKILGREAMVDKVHAAVDARRNDDLALLVRSDVVADSGPLEDALERVASYAEAGGDVI